MITEQATAQVLREALRPIWRQLTAGRSISVGKIGVLAYLSKHGQTSASTLAAAEKISPQAIANAVRELESLGLVVRTPDEQDRRRIWIELTDAGRERLAQERSQGLDWLEHAIAERLTDEEKKTLDSVVPILRKLVDDAPVD
ncbi:transcriptional regulator [Rhodococcus opacus PD630]|uniref:MarR family transcriptional regulator n=1 Tax=Rhodococcus opacus TaxID=37919 RepID=A0AAX3YBV6_RHOOP|nr:MULTISPECIES: MarR family transcriptional regulator [Rhodococcus]ELB90150.1 MarR family transcriptional regulator [Rhodococcus wratislaviensis IFP 2016]KXF49189.1 MarR family transcriptional regulator [Rhodococcus sp. SC4]NHU45854.1 MarR family transcriptional regulator [Rhodococcus sp. A14]RZK83417.1 MAG: MarR family transcriptional regulator [Rhodococcus sp. (in: high G+C Gram-positive bacteria)]AHK34449.1 putative HTH-type transcriptional regulator ywhA [Rhodococcus opacus PD630]